MKKILALEEGPGFGGALMSLKCLLENSSQEDYSFFVISNYHQDYISADGAVKDVTVQPRKRLYGKDTFLEKALRPVLGNKSGPVSYMIDRCTYCNAYVNKIVKYIKDNRIDIVHLNNWPLLNDGGLFAARKAKVPAIMHVRGIEYSSRLVSWISKKADHVIAISEYIRDQILALGISEQKISVIPNAVDAKSFAMNADGRHFREMLDLPINCPIVGIAGCLVDWKGHKYFIEACSEVFKNSAAHGMIIGDTPDGDPSFKIELQNYADKLGVLDRIHFVGHRRDINSAMDACDVLVHASTQPEPFGRVIIEAMALAKPVIATSPGGPKEIINDKIDGFLIQPADSFALAETISILLNDKSLCDEIGHNAREKVLTKYNVEAYVNAVARIYERL